MIPKKDITVAVTKQLHHLSSIHPSIYPSFCLLRTHPVAPALSTAQTCELKAESSMEVLTARSSMLGAETKPRESVVLSHGS